MFSSTVPENPKKWDRIWRAGAFSRFLTSIVAKHQKIEGGPFGDFFFEKSLTKPKKLKGEDGLVSPGIVGYVEKEEKPFWFNSLSQTIQFVTIKFRRTSKNYFGQFVWIEKKSHYNSRVSRHEAPTKNCGYSRVYPKLYINSCEE